MKLCRRCKGAGCRLVGVAPITYETCKKCRGWGTTMLKKQVRDYDDTFSAWDAVLEWLRRKK